MSVLAIPNPQHYTLEMRKSLNDKMFFMDKINASVIVDYGCADGSMIKFLAQLYPELTFIGYDISEEMIAHAQKGSVLKFTTSWEDVLHEIRVAQAQNKQTAIVLSSIIHEVYSYLNVSGVASFWEQVFKQHFDYIVIRDMIPSKTIDRASNINDIAKVYRLADKDHLFDFENKWGSIENNRNLIHFLLKYRYVENWQREVQENYVPLFREELLAKIPSGYTIIYHEHFVLPYIQNAIHTDFEIELKDNTHLKLILHRVP